MLKVWQVQRSFPTMNPDGADMSDSAPSRSNFRRRLLPALLVLAGATSLGPAPVVAQSAAGILGEAMERHDARLAGVENVTILQDVMGMSTTMYMVKEVVDGHAALRPVEGEIGGGGEFDLEEDVHDLWASPHQFYVELADRWVLDGRESVDGRESWTLVLTDLEDVDWGTAPGQEGDFHPERIEMKLSVDELVPLEMMIDGEVDVDGQLRPVSLRMRFSDYREVGGYLHPFVTAIETEMPEGQLSDEELEEARQALDEVRHQLEQAPAAQREMMERMMGDQIRMLEDLVAGEGIRIEMRVTDLRVNEGPPGT
jgi:hypothetical protein